MPYTPQLQYTNINGHLVPSDEAEDVIQNIPEYDQTGLLETILVHDGSIRLWDYHQARLSVGAQVLRLASINLQLFESEILKLVQKNNASPHARIRLQVFPDKKNEEVQYIIETASLMPEDVLYNEKGLTIGLFRDVLTSRNSTSNLKTTERNLYTQAQATAARNGWDDAIILNDNLHLIETTIANIFWSKDGTIYTPPLSEGCVAGVMRRHLLAELPAFGYRIRECSLTEDELLQANEVFVSNAIRGIRWVAALGTRSYSNLLSSKIASLLFS